MYRVNMFFLSIRVNFVLFYISTVHINFTASCRIDLWLKYCKHLNTFSKEILYSFIFVSGIYKLHFYTFTYFIIYQEKIVFLANQNTKHRCFDTTELLDMREILPFISNCRFFPATCII